MQKKTISIPVSLADEKKRLDKFIAEKLPEFSRAYIQKLIEDENVLLNGLKEKNNYRLKGKEEITLILEEPKEFDLKPVKMDLEIIYEDDFLAIINKPSGLVVHPGAGTKDDTLVHGLLAELDDLSGIGGILRPGIVHRIDKDTSGLLMIAKNDLAHESLSNQLSQKTTKRVYIALVYGTIPHDAGKINAPIGRSVENRKMMAVTEKGKKAVTHFTVLKRYKEFTLIECSLETGRTHQIRVHLQYIGFPVCGDKVYGFKKAIGENGQFLHAKTIGFLHPKTNEYMEFTSDLPDYFKDFLKSLE